jgi:mono/diheme cytochrome c family protein
MNKHRELWLGPIVLGTLCLFAIAAIALRFAATNVSASVSDAGSTYNAKCVKCHGRDGRGKTTQGRRGKMPAFKKSLNENQIDDLVNYVRRLRR